MLLILLFNLMSFADSPTTTTNQVNKTFSIPLGSPNSSILNLSNSSTPIPANTAITFPVGSAISFSATLYCGDGDVAKYYANNKSENYDTNHGTVPLKMVVGYWMEPSTGATAIPTNTNWHAIGYNDIGVVSASPVTSLIPPNGSAAVDAYSLVQSEIQNVLNQVAASPVSQTYNLYAAAMMCIDYTSKIGVGASSSAPASEIGNYIVSNASSDIAAIVSGYSLSSAQALKQIPIYASYSGGAFSVKSTGKKMINQSNLEKKLLASLAGLSYPTITATTTATDYNNAIKSQVDPIKALINGISPAASATSTKYWWESVPLNATAVMANQTNAAFDSLKADTTAGASLPQLSDFNTAAQNVAVAVLKVAAIESLQSEFANWSQDQIDCFPASGERINTIMASLGFPLAKPTAAGVVNFDATQIGAMSLPESFYALGANANYKNAYNSASGNNLNAVFMNKMGQLPSQVGTQVSTGTNYSFAISGAPSFNFHDRSFGCGGGVIYCQNATTDKLEYLRR